MRTIKFRARVLRSYLDHPADTDSPGVNQFEDTIDVRDISILGGDIDYVTDSEGDEYSYADGTLLGILQFTGLYDKHNTEIYEGDEVKVGGHPFEHCNGISGVYYNEHAEICVGGYLLHRMLPYAEVIGNIYEGAQPKGADEE